MTKIRATRALAPTILAILACLLPFSAAQAYVGPGLSAGAAAVVLGVIASVFLGLFAIVWYPLKRLMKKGKSATPDDENSSQEV